MRLSAAIWPLLAAAVTAYDFTESSEALLPVFVDSTLHHHPLRFDVLRTSSRCVGATHADDLALVQLDVAAPGRVGRTSSAPSTADQCQSRERGAASDSGSTDSALSARVPCPRCSEPRTTSAPARPATADHRAHAPLEKITFT